MHGIGGNRRNWRDNLPAFGEHFRAVAWDARGYGDSDDYEAEILAVRRLRRRPGQSLDHFGEERAHIIGLSMGGRIAMDFAYSHPHRLLTITLCATNTGFSRFYAGGPSGIRPFPQRTAHGCKEPADIAEPVARSLMGPKASELAFAQLVTACRDCTSTVT